MLQHYKLGKSSNIKHQKNLYDSPGCFITLARCLISTCSCTGELCTCVCVCVSPPAQVAEHSDQGRWFQVKPTSLSPLPVCWMGTLNLYLIPGFCSCSSTYTQRFHISTGLKTAPTRSITEATLTPTLTLHSFTLHHTDQGLINSNSSP